MPTWRNLQDTTNQPIIAYRAAEPAELAARPRLLHGGLVRRLDADTRLREATRRKSLDDFARRFFGVQDGELGPLTYTRDDVAHASELHEADWDGFLRERVDGHGLGAPLEGSRGRVAGRLQRSALTVSRRPRSRAGRTSPIHSATVDSADGKISDVVGAARPRRRPGARMMLLAVNGRAWSSDVLKEAIVAAKGGQGTIDLMVKNFDMFQTARLAYHDGLRYPHLERVPSTPDRLSELLKPRT